MVTPTDVKLYTYLSTGWKDKLVNYDGAAIAYDMVGNPWYYRGHNLEWDRIRLLTKWDDIIIDYNASGIRTRKGDTYYELDGDTIISETTNGNTIRYYYGNGGIVGFRYNGVLYYYEKNLQGDIIAIYNGDGDKLCEYVYDAWGNCTIKNDISDARIGEVNSFRYRGYYYDSDLGLYYLKSRYYDAVTGRFINADEIEFLGAGDDLGAYNLFAYCANNPISNFDDNGNWSMPNWLKVTVGAVATVAAVAVTVATGGAAAPILIGVATSTISGAAVSAVNHRVTTGSWEGAGEAALDGAADGFMWGGVCAFASSSISAIKAVQTAKSGIAMGENMQRVKKAAQVVDGTTYKPMKGYKLIKKFPKIGQQLADNLSLAHNKAFITRMTKLGAPIYDTGPVGINIASKWYAMERQVVNGYFNYVKMF